MKNPTLFSFLISLSVFQISLNCSANSSNNDFGFIENKGQVHDQFGNSRDDVRFIFEQQDFKIILRNDGFSYEFTDAVSPGDNFPESGLWDDEDNDNYKSDPPVKITANRIDIDFKGCLPDPQITGELPSPFYSSYFNQYTGEKGIVRVQNFNRVIYKNIYKNIDLVFSFDEKNNKRIPKYEFTLHAGSNPDDIKMSVSGSDQIKITGEGSLNLTVPQGFVNESQPVILSPDRSRIKSCSFIQKEKTIGFSAVKNFATFPCIIDPEIAWGTYYGGKNKDLTDEIATDHEDNVYMSARVRSNKMIATIGAYQTAYGGNGDAALIKFDGEGNLLWATYYGGSGTEIGFAITIDPFDNAWIAGHTDSPSGIATTGAFDETFSGGFWDVLLAKFNPDGALLYGTYIGDELHDEAQGVCSNANGDIFVSGYTESSTAMATPDAFKPVGAYDGESFLEKFSNDGHRLYGTYFGGMKRDRGHGVTVDNFGHVYQVGTSDTKTGLATADAFQIKNNGVNDVFLIKWTESGQLLWSTYFGGEGDDRGRDVRTDMAGNIYFIAQTESETNISTPGVFKDTLHFFPDKNRDAFVAKFDSFGNRVWCTYFGGEAIDMPRSLRVDPNGAPVYIAGYTRSKEDFVTPDAYNIRRGGGNDAFFAIINWNASHLLYSTYYGGRNSESVTEGGWYGPTMDLDSQGSIYISSCTNSDDSIATFGSYMDTVNDTIQYDLFLAKFTNPCIDAFEPQNDAFETAPSLRFNSTTKTFSAKGTIESDLDKDYLRITGPAGIDSLSFHLTNLPFDCNLFVYDENKALLGKSQNTGIADEDIVLPNTGGAAYIILIKSPTHEFSSYNCYSLTISPADQVRLSNINNDSHFTLFPNPSDDRVQISLANLIEGMYQIQLMNSVGMIISHSEVSLDNESDFEVNTQNLPSGIYEINIKGNRFSETQRLVIQHQ